MRIFALAATAAAAALVCAPASAAVFISFDGVTTEFTQADGVFEFTADCGGVADCGGFEAITVEGSAPLTLPGLLHTDNVSVNAMDSGAASITIWVTRTDLSGPLGDSFFSSFTSNNQGGPISVHLETLIDNNNGLYGGALLASFDHNAAGAAASNVDTTFTPSGLFSVTEKYVITAAASSSERSASPTISLAGSPAGVVPEPATWALMIMGFGGAGAVMRRRRHLLAAS